MAAGAHCTYLNFSLPLKKPLMLSLSSFPTNPKLRRRNHLREKLLKTLIKPYHNPITPFEPPTNPIIPIEPERVEEPAIMISREKEEIGGVIDVVKGEFGKYWVLKLGLYLVGIFVFQTICAVLVFGSDDVVREEGKDLVFEGKSREKSNFLLNGNGCLDVSIMDPRIDEIQVLARDARESERLKSRAAEEDNGGNIRTGIEKEVDGRLVRLQGKLQSRVNKMSPIPVIEKDGPGGKDKFEPLMIKKKYKFRSPLGDLSDKPKGFTGTKDFRASESDNSVLAVEDDGNVFDSLSQLSVNSSVGVTQPLGEETERTQSKGRSKCIQTSGKKLRKERMGKAPGRKNIKVEPASRMGKSDRNKSGYSI